MVYYSSILFPSEEELDSYDLVDTYPFPLFWRKRLFELPLSDITVLYGNNGSGKSTLLSLIGLLLKAERDVPLYDDTTYKLEGRAYHPFHDFAGMMEARRAVDAYGDKLDEPRTRAFLTSDGLFRKIAARREENRATRIRRDELRKKRGELARSAYYFDSLDDLDDLRKRNEALRTTARSYGLRHGGNLEEERSNGESAVDIFLSILEKDGFYLIDEPENCLSLPYQAKVADIMRYAAFHEKAQLLVATHSPIFLSMEGASVIDLDEEPPRKKKWTELANVVLLRDFFLSHEKDFDGD